MFLCCYHSKTINKNTLLLQIKMKFLDAYTVCLRETDDKFQMSRDIKQRHF